MDCRVALLYQTFSGVRFSEDQFRRILAPAWNGQDQAAAIEQIADHPLAKTWRDWWPRFEDLYGQAEVKGVRWAYPGHPQYPKPWNHLSTSGPCLFSYIGEPVWCSLPMISIVGSRSPSRDTCLWLQKEIPRFFNLAPFSIASGGARGVDQWVHRLSVDHKRPTVLVFPSGVLNPYPPDSGDLIQRILAGGGACLSTFALNQTMRRHLFVIRNRWIAGLSSLTFVAEARRRSGSSLTGKLARDEGRVLCTLPMSPMTEAGLGNLDLLATDRAHMIRHAEDLAAIADFNRNMFGL